MKYLLLMGIVLVLSCTKTNNESKEAEEQPNGLQIEWVVVEDKGEIPSYRIELSNDGHTFRGCQTLTDLKVHLTANSDQLKIMEEVDISNYPNDLYYRIKVSSNGNVTYSKIIKAR